ncbi:unnamed protein product [Lupinus luteus]|uniref:Cytochrome P450 n=1 Tax=Lupinus luteus TaxID=3873 RepID=A0AAV1VWE4_LUPLU
MDHPPSVFLYHIEAFWPALFIIVSTFFIIKVLKYHMIEKPRKCTLPPGPKPWPIVGQLPKMLANKPASMWIHKVMKEMKTEIACIRLGNVHVIPVSCPSIAREFLRKHDTVFASRPMSNSTEIVSNGYLTTAFAQFGEQWRKMKKILINDLFSFQKHQWLQEKRNEEADNLMFYVYNKCKNVNEHGLVNVRIAAQHYCGNVIRKLIFNTRYFGKGREDGGPGFEEVEHIDSIFTLLRYVFAFCVSDYMPCLRGFNFDGHEKKVHKELMLAALDNPSNAAEWALAEMINQPELFQKGIEELDNVVGKHRLVQESDIPKLNFVKACAREAFRLHPMAPFNLPHVATKDTVVTNYFIPKGSHVLLSKQELGRNPKVWNDPLKFKPERHLKNDGSEVVLIEPDLRFISFSTGRRSCPAVMLGTTMTVMLLARLLHGFTWSASPNVSCINLVESNNGDMLLAEPLVAVAKPRLASELY